MTGTDKAGVWRYMSDLGGIVVASRVRRAVTIPQNRFVSLWDGGPRRADESYFSVRMKLLT